MNCQRQYEHHPLDQDLDDPLVFLGLTSTTQAATINLAWNPNTETDLAGHSVSYGTKSSAYAVTIDVGKNPSQLAAKDPFRNKGAVLAADASRRASLLVAHTRPVCALLAPRRPYKGLDNYLLATLGPDLPTAAGTIGGGLAMPTSASTLPFNTRTHLATTYDAPRSGAL